MGSSNDLPALLYETNILFAIWRHHWSRNYIRDVYTSKLIITSCLVATQHQFSRASSIVLQRKRYKQQRHQITAGNWSMLHISRAQNYACSLQRAPNSKRTTKHNPVFCNIGFPSETQPTPKSHKSSFSRNTQVICRMVLILCTEHGICALSKISKQFDNRAIGDFASFAFYDILDRYTI